MNTSQIGFYPRRSSGSWGGLIVFTSLVSMGAVAAIVVAPYVAAIIIAFR